jgi:hypothetical protein
VDLLEAAGEDIAKVTDDTHPSLSHHKPAAA